MSDTLVERLRAEEYAARHNTLGSPEYVASLYAEARGAIKELGARLEAWQDIAYSEATRKNARITALEKALRETASEAHSHGLVRDHPDLFDVCPNYICRLARGEKE